MSLFRGIKRVWKEGREDDALIREAAGRQPIFNNKCQFRYFGFYDLQSMPFYVIGGLTSAPRPTDFKVCQECFLASIAPCPSLAKKFVREIKSSKDPEELVQCTFSDPRNEPSWRAVVQQQHEGPFMQRLQELAFLEANMGKCPTLLKASEIQATVSGSSFRIPRSQRLLKDSSGVCEYHYAAVIKGGLMEDEFIRASTEFPPSECIYGAPETGPFATIAFLTAEKTFNFKVFDDWLEASLTEPDCNGIIESSSRRYVLPAVQYTTKDQFQVCERCYRLIFHPHAVIRPQFRQLASDVSRKRQICSINSGSIPGYFEAAVKSTWRQDPNMLLQHARQQAPIPNCPGSVNATPMRIWYASMATENEPVTCCEACFHQHIISTSLFGSFKPFTAPHVQESQQCIMSIVEVQRLFAKACKTKQISVFHKDILEYAQNIQSNAELAQQNAERVKRNAEQPELDLSNVRGTPQQIQQIESLRDEIIRMSSNAENMTALANNQILCGMTRASGGRLASLAGSGGYYTRVSDGHGNWFDSQSEAVGSQMQIEGKMKLTEAFNLRSEVIRKRLELSRLKATLGA